MFTRLSFGADPSPVDLELTRSMVAAMSPTAVSGLLPGLLSFDVQPADRGHRPADLGGGGEP